MELQHARRSRFAEVREETPTIETSSWTDVQERETEWLKPQEIPRHEMTLYTGRGDLGKSTLVADLLARATRGQLSGEPERVLYVAEGEVGAEYAKTLLSAAGADQELVTFDKPRSLMTIPDDIPKLIATIRKIEIGVVGFDNMEAHVNLDGGDAYAENSIRRRVVNPLRFAAQETGVAILGIKHPPKAGGVHAHDMFGGSVAWINASRSGFLVRPDPDQLDRRVRLLLHVKGNLAQRLVEAREYRIVPSHWKPQVPVVAWGDERPEVTMENFNAETFRDQLPLLIRAALRREPLPPAEVAKRIPDYDKRTVAKRMQRMWGRGELKRLEDGRYAVPV
jgi:AAA domain